MRRRTVLAGLGAAAGLAACGRQSSNAVEPGEALDLDRLKREIPAIADRAEPGVLGVAISQPHGGDIYSFNGSRHFPMQSVFKALLAAAALAEVDGGRLSLDEVIEIRDVDLSPAFSPVADAWPGVRRYTVGDLLIRAAGQSDNTAADLLMKRIGGPGAVTAWLVSKGVKDLRVDRYERELQPEIMGLASFRAAWKGEAAYRAALDAVPEARQREATKLYLADVRDTATPIAMAQWLDDLASGDVLSPSSTARLLGILTGATTGAARLRAALPAGARLAHKTGTARTIFGVNPATNDVGIYTLEDGRRLTVAVFLSGATLDDAGREAIIADVGRAALAALR